MIKRETDVEVVSKATTNQRIGRTNVKSYKTHKTPSTNNMPHTFLKTPKTPYTIKNMRRACKTPDFIIKKSKTPYRKHVHAPQTFT